MSTVHGESMNPLAARMAVASQDEMGLDEVKRIIRLPVDRPLEPQEVEEVSRMELTREAWDSGFRLWEQQARATIAIYHGGAFCPLRVGGGKDLIAWLACKHFFQRKGAERVLALVPPRLHAKALLRGIPFARRMIGLTAPVHGMGGLPASRRLALARSRWRGIYVYPYSLLSEETAEEELALIDPDAVTSDESHALKNKIAARTKRFLAMMARRLRLFVALSGTMAKRSLRDYHHLIFLTLREKCPLPRDIPTLENWASALDTGGQVWQQEGRLDAVGDAGLEPMRLWAFDAVRKGIISPEEVGGPLTPDVPGYRRAFRARRNSAPGVIASAEEENGSSLSIQNAAPKPPLDDAAVLAFEEGLAGRFTGEEFFVPRDVFAELPPFMRMLALLWAVRERATTPNGDQLQHAIHGFKWSYEISAGFYNELTWPTAEDVAQKRLVSLEEATDLLERSRTHHEAERKKDREVRKFLEGDHVSGVDTPALVGAECARGGARVPDKLLRLWQKTRDLDFEERVERISTVRRVCDWKIRALAAWAKTLPEKKGALVWVHNIEVGIWTVEILRETLGVARVIHCPAGTKKADEDMEDPKNADKILVASLKGHSEGKNVTFLSDSYFLQFPRSADMAEQALGRTHRPGQEDDEVRAYSCLVTSFDHECLDATLHDAMFLHQSEGPQRLVYADWPETPRLHPTDFLEQRGFDLLAKGRDDIDATLRAVLAGGKNTEAA